jgi:ribosomal protein S18 acetylase RimI-like enzyme
MSIDLRAAQPQDVPFARSVFLATMGDVIRQLFGWDDARQAEHFAEFFRVDEARIITSNGRDVGWIQEQATADAINIGSLYISPTAQRCGIGGTIVEQVADRAACESKAVTLSVVKINPALHFYARHGFRIVGEDDYKFYLRRDT